MSIHLKNAMEDSFLSYYSRAFEKQNYSNDKRLMIYSLNGAEKVTLP